MRQAAERYQIPVSDWLDLSTGINPDPWPVPRLSPHCWWRLPEDEDGLDSAAADYYGASSPLPLAGSQAAIQALPMLRESARVGIQRLGYREHAHAWRRAGHSLIELDDEAIEAHLDDSAGGLDVLVVINPNNPSGRCWPIERLLAWHARLAERGGWLVVDEAFMDATPGASLLPYAGREGLVVLRSLGKFFGLAGARVGFLFAEPRLRERVRRLLGPWTLASPAREVARLALSDRGWQERERRSLPLRAARLADLLDRHGLTPAGGTALFQWVRTQEAVRIQDALACRAILVRRFDAPQSLRFGLPGDVSEWQRLAGALDSSL
ncbi:threonine-phosphate decarboxylase CobD [Imhoffiella purpurea]|uniref:threonine-phosphate decarboxylase n=1 Tax=Imhoffiella purpurea TaxID=1249627 RepID=W9VZ74_9GAMM|nr:threonine-phosphate decarboxylase CobD [Imhoffiella purpurea]EXJ15695.1 L-threonine 3-O-phosphate decarboxylase [Imhoffiella purpurea]